LKGTYAVRLTISNKIVLSFVVVLILCVGLGADGIWSNLRSAGNYEDMIDRSLPLEEDIHRVGRAMLERAMALRACTEQYDESLVTVCAQLNQDIRKILTGMDKHGLYDESVRLRNEIIRIDDEYRSSAEKAISAARAGYAHEAEALERGLSERLLNSLNPVVDEWLGFIEPFNIQWYADANKGFQMGIVLIAVCTALAAVAVVVMSIVLSRSIAGPLGKMTRVAEAMSKGDLTVKPPDFSTGDEIDVLNQAVKAMVMNLIQLVREAHDTADLLGGSSSGLQIADPPHPAVCPRQGYSGGSWNRTASRDRPAGRSRNRPGVRSGGVLRDGEMTAVAQ